MSDIVDVRLFKPYAAWKTGTLVPFNRSKALRLVKLGFGEIVEEKPKSKKRKGTK